MSLQEEMYTAYYNTIFFVPTNSRDLRQFKGSMYMFGVPNKQYNCSLQLANFVNFPLKKNLWPPHARRL